MTAARIDVVLPVLDEAGALPWVLERLPDGYHAIVVDNGSTDGSADIARDLGATVVAEPRRGFGAACWTGLATATSEVIAFMDADASLDPRELPRLCDPVIRDRADLVVGARHATAGAWPWHARLANKYLARRIRQRTGFELSDLGPMRATRRQALLDLQMTDRGFGWPLEMVLKAGHARWRVEELPVSYRPRIGRSKVTGTVRGTARAGRDMSRLLRASP